MSSFKQRINFPCQNYFLSRASASPYSVNFRRCSVTLTLASMLGFFLFVVSLISWRQSIEHIVVIGLKRSQVQRNGYAIDQLAGIEGYINDKDEYKEDALKVTQVVVDSIKQDSEGFNANESDVAERASPTMTVTNRTHENILKDDSGQQIKFIFYRAIGNDLVPYQAPGENYRNLKFILENEPQISSLDRRWLVNRIFNSTEEQRIIDLLEKWQQKYICLPFLLEEYLKVEMEYEGYGRADFIHSTNFLALNYSSKMAVTDRLYHNKNRYVLNENGARNLMIDEGIKAGAMWIFPCDSNCFMTRQAWEDISMGLLAGGHKSKYFTVATSTIADGGAILDPSERMTGGGEPHVIFRNDSKERFNLKLRSGTFSKAELLCRLRVPGPWPSICQSLPRYERISWDYSDDLGAVNSAPQLATIARLAFGKPMGDECDDCEIARIRSIELLLDSIDVQIAKKYFKFNENLLLAYNETVLAAERSLYQAKKNASLNYLIDQLLNVADAALQAGPFSVVDKTELPPSKNKHDYYTPSPYFWPNPDTPDGLPYVRRDGERVPGTELYDEKSNRYDRTRIANFFGNTTCLALAWYFSQNEVYAQKAAVNIRTWFLDDATKMNPHMRYAQIQWGNRDNVGVNYGIIETKDFYYLLDAVKLVYSAGKLSSKEISQLKIWFREFSEYLRTSQQGLDEFSRYNNHGLYYDIQLSAITAFLGDVGLYLNHTERAKSRICTQFRPAGTLPHESDRPTSLHYIMFTMQGWLTLGRLAKYGGVELFDYGPKHPREWNKHKAIRQGLLLWSPHFNSTWEHDQAAMVDMDRFYPIYYMGREAYSDLTAQPARETVEGLSGLYEVKPIFYSHDGIQPFWNLGLHYPE